VRFCILLLVTGFAGCVFSGDGGILGRDPTDPRGVSATMHWHAGGGGGRSGRFLASAGVDTHIDVASGGSRWSGGGSVLGGVRTGPLYFDARAGVWRAIVSSTSEGLAPTFEVGGYVPLDEHDDPKHPEHGYNNSGVVFGIRQDFDVVNYFTVFIGYALFIIPGY
jgi:hypothetical protein